MRKQSTRFLVFTLVCLSMLILSSFSWAYSMDMKGLRASGGVALRLAADPMSGAGLPEHAIAKQTKYRVSWPKNRPHKLRVECWKDDRYVALRRRGTRVEAGSKIRITYDAAPGVRIVCNGRPYVGPFELQEDMTIGVGERGFVLSIDHEALKRLDIVLPGSKSAQEVNTLSSGERVSYSAKKPEQYESFSVHSGAMRLGGMEGGFVVKGDMHLRVEYKLKGASKPPPVRVVEMGGLLVDTAGGVLRGVKSPGDTLRIELEEVESIDDGAFANCGGVKVLYLGGALREVEGKAFRDLANLREVYLASTVGRIARSSLVKNAELRVINLPHLTPEDIDIEPAATKPGIILRVPEQSLDIYRNSHILKRFRTRMYADECTMTLRTERESRVVVDVQDACGQALRHDTLTLPGEIGLRGGDLITFSSASGESEIQEVTGGNEYTSKEDARSLMVKRSGEIKIKLPTSPSPDVASRAEVASLPMSVFPNPTRSQLSIASPFEAAAHYRIFRTDGLRVRAGELPVGLSRLDLGGLPPGLYTLEVYYMGERRAIGLFKL